MNETMTKIGLITAGLVAVGISKVSYELGKRHVKPVDPILETLRRQDLELIKLREVMNTTHRKEAEIEEKLEYLRNTLR